MLCSQIQVLKFVIARRYYAEINVLRYSTEYSRSVSLFFNEKIFTAKYRNLSFFFLLPLQELLATVRNKEKCQTTSEKKVEKKVKKGKKKKGKKNYYRSRFECALSKTFEPNVWAEFYVLKLIECK